MREYPEHNEFCSAIIKYSDQYDLKNGAMYQVSAHMLVGKEGDKRVTIVNFERYPDFIKDPIERNTK